MSHPDEITHRIRWHSRWLGASLLFICLAGFTGGLLSTFDREHPDWIGLTSAIPFFLAATYGSLCLGFNTERIRITPSGVDVRGEPFPGGYIARSISPADIASCYIRYATYLPKSGIDSHWAAGIITQKGNWVDLLAPLPTREEALASATRIATILGKPAPHEIQGWPPRDLALLWKVLSWGGTFIFALLWLAAIEVLR